MWNVYPLFFKGVTTILLIVKIIICDFLSHHNITRHIKGHNHGISLISFEKFQTFDMNLWQSWCFSVATLCKCENLIFKRYSSIHQPFQNNVLFPLPISLWMTNEIQFDSTSNSLPIEHKSLHHSKFSLPPTIPSIIPPISPISWTIYIMETLDTFTTIIPNGVSVVLFGVAAAV